MRRRTGPLIVIGLGAALQPLDTSVNVAFPAITAAFGLPLQSIQWIAIAYVLTYAAIVLVCGRLGDLYGHRLIFRLGLLISVVALTLCALAETYAVLLGFRVLQGVGTALVMSCAPALTVALYPEAERTKALSVYGMLYSAGIAAGPVIGGFAIDAMGWQGVYWFRVPVAILALAASGMLAVGARGVTSGNRFDPASAMLLAFWMSAILLGLALLQAPGGPLVPAMVLAVIGLGALIAFILRERRSANPTIRLSLFADRRFSAINALNIAVFLTGFGALLLVPYYLVRVLALDVRAIGLTMTLWAAGSMLGAWLAGRIKTLSQPALAFCFGWVLCLGLALAALCNGATGLALIGAALLVQGIALGGFQVAYTDTVVAGLRQDERGVAGSLAMLTRTLGTVGGAIVLAACYAGLEAGALAAGQPPPAAFIVAFVYVFAGSAVAIAVLLLATLAVFRTAR